ncbi:ATP-binding protein [Corallococcus macrosporus]|uniref:histidine kinase n=1 Tax=Corallococcus macrosporus DSM 14697 TaxID=1189310 RepID=A0A250JNL8_9BACT|nr:ATP-binding protein [Corallococcus macrosporus]ATB44716.1 histidine kinase [Corallococcus macrosporus DSM 14697]
MRPVRVLVVEDNPDDEVLMLRELRRAGFLPETRRVQSAESLRAALVEQDWDIILSDFCMPRFTALEVLKVLKATGLDIPVIVVSGSIGEDEAVEAMKAGARDYFAKGRLTRLAAAVERELAEARARRERARAELDRGLLAQASEVLVEPLDLEERLSRLAWVPVPRVADLCVIFLHEERRGGLRISAVAHRDEAIRSHLWEMDRRFPLTSAVEAGPLRVLSTAEPELVVDLQAARVSVTSSPEHQRALDALGLRSALSVPLRGRSGLLGVLSLATQGARTLGPVDLSLAQELARRAGLSLENARLLREVQDAVRLRDEFLVVAAHELRTPLTTLRLQLGSLLSPATRERLGAMPPEVETRLERSMRQVLRLGTLVEGLLDVSRLGAGDVVLSLERFELAELVSEVVERYGAEAAAAGSPVRLTCEAGLWGRWDRLRVEQAVAALVSNALKFAPGHPVEVAVTRVGRMGRVQVDDRGIGITEDQVKHIFERFGRAVSSRSYGGLGLGLYLVRRSAEAHGGRAWAGPREGGGARFTLDLPLEKERRE